MQLLTLLVTAMWNSMFEKYMNIKYIRNMKWLLLHIRISSESGLLALVEVCAL